MPELRARGLRKAATQAELVLWCALRQIDIPGTHFRRQVPLRGYIVDFACHKAKLIVELDGAQHGMDETIVKDAARTAAIEIDGYHVLRFWNHDVLRNTESVVETILHELRRRLLNSSGADDEWLCDPHP
jgi:very-short-patch-repair endonuclease